MAFVELVQTVEYGLFIGLSRRCMDSSAVNVGHEEGTSIGWRRC